MVSRAETHHLLSPVDRRLRFVGCPQAGLNPPATRARSQAPQSCRPSEERLELVSGLSEALQSAADGVGDVVGNAGSHEIAWTASCVDSGQPRGERLRCPATADWFRAPKELFECQGPGPCGRVQCDHAADVVPFHTDD